MRFRSFALALFVAQRFSAPAWAFDALVNQSSNLKSIELKPLKIIQGMTTSPTSSAGGFTFQNVERTTAADVLSPQQPSGWFTYDGIRSTMVTKPDATARTTSAFGFYVRNEAPESKTGATGVFGTTACVVDHSACWGLNPTVIDAPANGTVTRGLGRKLIGLEINPSVTSSDTVLQGVSILGSTIAQPKFSAAFTVGHLSAVHPDRLKWDHAFVVADGTSSIGYLTGAFASSGSSVPGIPNYLNYRDATGTSRALSYQATATGSLNIALAGGANGIAITPQGAGISPTITAYGTDANVGLQIQAQGAGEIVTQSPINAQQGLYVTRSAQFAAPLRLRAYVAAALPSCNSGLQDAMAVVVDAKAPTYRSAVSGGGGIRTPVYCDGEVWTVR